MILKWIPLLGCCSSNKSPRYFLQSDQEEVDQEGEKCRSSCQEGEGTTRSCKGCHCFQPSSQPSPCQSPSDLGQHVWSDHQIICNPQQDSHTFSGYSFPSSYCTCTYNAEYSQEGVNHKGDGEAHYDESG